jgi:glycosyltransferase involved in cell wall biosynthesis
MGLGAVVSVAPIEVVLPTYNGVLYLEAQIASIYNQTLRPERVLLRDDGSSDGTQALISQLQQRYGTWLQVLPADGNLGCTANVNRLLQATTAPYVALADQDDLWISQKLEISKARLQQMENLYGLLTPLLVHSDLELVDVNANILGVNYLQRQHLNALRTTEADLALTNVVTGCTTLINRALLDKASPIPSQALMHDWWLALVAASFGKIELIHQPTVKYRQHCANLLGARGLGIAYWSKRLLSLFNDPSGGCSIRACALQAECFSIRYSRDISVLPFLLKRSRSRRILCLFYLNKPQRPAKHGPIRTIALYCFLLFAPALKEGRVLRA